MGAPRKLDDATLQALDEKLRQRHHMLLAIVNLRLTVKALSSKFGVHPETIRKRDYQLHGAGETLNRTHITSD